MEIKQGDVYLVSERVVNKVYIGESTVSFEDARKHLNAQITSGGRYALFDMDEPESIHNSGKRTRV